MTIANSIIPCVGALLFCGRVVVCLFVSGFGSLLKRERDSPYFLFGPFHGLSVPGCLAGNHGFGGTAAAHPKFVILAASSFFKGECYALVLLGCD